MDVYGKRITIINHYWNGRNKGVILPLIILLLLFAINQSYCDDDDQFSLNDNIEDEKKKFGDKCRANDECGYKGAICDSLMETCACSAEVPVTNHIDKCGIAAKVNESCFFNEQCETVYYLTECRNNVCTCRFERVPVQKSDGSYECIEVAKNNSGTPERYIDPAMIIILVAMFFMFITICVVFRLFSNARWRENRTIFNTPNARLMNVSLLRDSKILHHGERRASQQTSRPPSMTSIPPQSPNSLGSQRESKASSPSSGISPSGTKPSNRQQQKLSPENNSCVVEIQQHENGIKT